MRYRENFKRTLKVIYRRLLKRFGPQRWWPGETPFEIAVGAILTQNTSWSNAAQAVTALKKAHSLEPNRLYRLPSHRLAPLIRSSGYFNLKAIRLKAFVHYLQTHYQGEIVRMKQVPLSKLRKELLNIDGIGQETADNILLYALNKPTFVVDAYTRRILARHSFISWDASYEEIQNLFFQHLPQKTSLLNEYHALIVALGKTLCRRTQPKCHLCPLKNLGHLQLERSAHGRGT